MRGNPGTEVQNEEETPEASREVLYHPPGFSPALGRNRDETNLNYCTAVSLGCVSVFQMLSEHSSMWQYLQCRHW